ncbi:MAG TPA: nitroreductase family deazaflavin-dependent oxidoreductase, partial [Alphaproteobacteria bacterium]|nr:nitroreductase family deazaflavin-dependent oxidoreductase [Alphaproteobacteria bacterium]
MLLTSRGAKTGKKRTVAILYLKTDDGYAVVASYGGADKHPAWFVNLRNDPNAEIQAGAQSFKVLSRIATRDEKAELWP